MGIFSRFSDIVHANINAMLDKAEEPEKMVKLMVYEMEDTLTEVKSSAAEVVADRIRVQRQISYEENRVKEWEHKAEFALSKGREDLSREALEQKLHALRQIDQHRARLLELDQLEKQYQHDILQLEDKLTTARNRERVIVAAHQSALNRRRVEEQIYRANSSGAFARFESYEHKIDRYQADAQVMAFSNNHSIEKKFEDLAKLDAVDQEMAKLKARLGSQPSAATPTSASSTPAEAAPVVPSSSSAPTGTPAEAIFEPAGAVN